ncbi:MAG: metal-dependent transcriptional regulator [Clostridiales bacterium]|jgi:Mn-dependent DtxR family transcriptional regulator|nr:metal-dependent transcriptional regulator [Clostridiales bacterium]
MAMGSNKLSFVLENYLEAIYELSNAESGTGARLTDVARRLSVTKATANSAMASLSEKGFVENGRYQQIHLTPEGAKMAESVAEKHKTIQKFFTDVLLIDDAAASADACVIEHVISERAVEAMRRYLAR